MILEFIWLRQMGWPDAYIELSSGEELLSTLSMLKDTVIAGELDDAITNASDNLRAGFSK